MSNAFTEMRSAKSIEFLDVPAQLMTGEPKEIVGYLMEAHRRYEYSVIPRIEQQFVGLVKLHPHAPELTLIFNLFQKFQLEMQWHMQQEEKDLYPKALAGELDPPSKSNDISHEDQEPFLFEVIQLLKNSRHANGTFCQMLIGNLERFEEDLRLHSWVEEHLLVS